MYQGLEAFLGSVGKPDFNHWLQPSLSAYTFVKPFLMSVLAIQALVCSLGQSQ